MATATTAAGRGVTARPYAGRNAARGHALSGDAAPGHALSRHAVSGTPAGHAVSAGGRRAVSGNAAFRDRLSAGPAIPAGPTRRCLPIRERRLRTRPADTRPPTRRCLPAPAPSSGRGLILGLVAAVVLVGILGTAALIVMLRPRTTEPPERTPVTMRPTLTAEGSDLDTAVPPAPRGGGHVAPAFSPEAASAPVATPAAAPIGRPSAPPPSAAPRPHRPRWPKPPRRRAHPRPRTARGHGGGAAPPHPPSRRGKVDLGEKFYEKTLAYEAGTPISFDGHVGPIKAATVQFSVGDKKGRFGKVDELKTEVRAVLPVLDCPKGAGEWDYKLVVELLDKSGRRLDKLEGGGSCENEIKTVAATRAVLKALVPAIRGVRVRLEAAKD